MKWIQYLSLCLIFTDSAFSANITEVETLYTNLLSGYNKYVRPLTSTSVPVYVNATFSLVGIQEFDEVNGKFSVIGFFTITWSDSRLAWTPLLYSNLSTIELPESQLWIPNLTLINSYDRIEGLGRGIVPVTVTSTGMAYWSPGDVISSTCDIDVTYYPFDTQSCSMMLTCWGFTPTAIVTQAQDTQISLDYFSEHGTWELLDKKLNTFLTSTSSFISIDMKLKRRPAFAVINIVLPMVFMVVLNLLVFVLPVESGERVSYSITVLLAIAVFLTLVGDNLPKTSKPTAMLSYFLLADLVLSSLICVFVILGLTIYYKDDSEKPVPNIIARIVKFCCHSQKWTGRIKNQTIVEPYKDNSADKKFSLPDYDEEDGDEVKVTWKMVSNCFDWIVFVTCLLVIVILTILYFSMTM
ncbi:neuronal acetylcholine receptor subunit alpha-2-like [Ostrea edulis]|uniref:neuronal acetylcholine receptor subunit alpha-2-like n=1 Tax=Ostrea edulis TaxID=37623 RepID=UPI0024AF0F52|nr:neuronal acetylcholine receptor subunit alpha-2-like [Ostrea edulis]